MAEGSENGTQRAFVFAPAPLLTVTIEDAGGEPEIHLHAGGQGFWIARLMAALDVDVSLCATFGGEPGRVLETLVCDEGIAVRGLITAGRNGVYVHDRRMGERVAIAEMAPMALSRHEVDELYGAALVDGLEADVCVLGGPGADPQSPLPADVYRRLANDLSSNGRTVVADLAGEPLDAALEGGVAVLKVSDQELLADGRVPDTEVDTLLKAVTDLAGAGAGTVVVTRAEQPALASIDGEVYAATPPTMEALDHRGAGDSMTAGLAAALARGDDVTDALRLGAAAGALNVTRRGLATGRRQEIQRLARHVAVERL